MKNFLVIVDMQPVFDAAQNTELISRIRGQIKQAKRRGDVILVVEYASTSNYWSAYDKYARMRTDMRLMREIGDYSQVYHIMKSSDNGGWSIYRALKRLTREGYLSDWWTTAKYRVCGVNATACVLATVDGLSKRMPRAKIEVINSCCRNEGMNRAMTKRYFQELMPKNAVVV